jgi:small subunit ribosomal protein S20
VVPLRIVRGLLFFFQCRDFALANSPQAIKRARQNDDQRLRNASRRSALRTAVKRVLAAIRAGDADTATTQYRVAVPLLDRTAARGLIHKNKAARHKSRLNKRIVALSQAMPAAEVSPAPKVRRASRARSKPAPAA